MHFKISDQKIIIYIYVCICLCICTYIYVADYIVQIHVLTLNLKMPQYQIQLELKKKKFIHIHMNIYFASLIATRLKHATCFIQNFLCKFLSRNFSAMYNNNIIHCMITTQKSKLFSENIFLRNYLENYYRHLSNRILFQILRSYLLLYIITLSLQYTEQNKQ